MMRSFYAVYRKEMGHYFVSPVAYVVIGLFTLITGALFYSALGSVIREGLQSMQFGGMPPNLDMPGEVMRYFFGSVFSLFTLLVLPAVTMGIYAEERKRGTMELLLTSPITETQLVLGKFFASLTVFVAMLVPSVASVVYMYLNSTPVPSWRLMFTGYLGALLFGASLLALGTFFSSLTESQIIAFVFTLAAFLMLWIIYGIVDLGASSSGALASVVGYLSVIRHYDGFTRGTIDTSDIIYYLSFTFLFIFLTVRSVDSMRWRRA